MTPFVLFDAYGTLVELDDFYGRLQAGFARLGASLPREVIVRAAHEEMKHYIAHSKRARDWKSWHKVRRECALILADSVRAQGHALALRVSDVSQVLSDAIVFRAFPDTLPALEELKARGVRMAVLSNWDYRLPHALKGLNLDSFFDFVMTSAKAGAQKPDAGFFERGLRLAREKWTNLTTPSLLAGQCVYIGDHFEKDVLASRRAGLTPFWLVRDKRDLTSGETHEANDPVVRLSSLKDLPQLLEKLSGVSSQPSAPATPTES